MKHRPVIYLAGPMRGYIDDNFPRFMAAAAWLRADGWAVMNPAEFWGGAQDLPFAAYMRHDLMALLTSADAIALLPGWERSEGAMLERKVAKVIGLRQIMVPSEILPPQHISGDSPVTETSVPE